MGPFVREAVRSWVCTRMVKPLNLSLPMACIVHKTTAKNTTTIL
jgi:hypothetical protein